MIWDLSGKSWRKTALHSWRPRKLCVPQTYISLDDEDDIKNMNKLLEMLEDNDDVQNVWHNWENPTEA